MFRLMALVRKCVFTSGVLSQPSVTFDSSLTFENHKKKNEKKSSARVSNAAIGRCAVRHLDMR